MRFITFEKDKKVKLGLDIPNEGIIDLQNLDKSIPNDLNDLIKNYSLLETKLKSFNTKDNVHYKNNEVKILAPIPEEIDISESAVIKPPLDIS